MKYLLTFYLLFFVTIELQPQYYLLGYSFDPWGYAYYTELTDATISTAVGENGAENINLPFEFPYMGETYSTARISVNGWIQLGQNYTGPGNDNDLASTITKPFICPFWDNLIDDEASEIRYKTIGLSPARVFIVEWKNILVSSARKSFQVKLHEIDGTIEFHYGPQTGDNGFSASVGMNDHIGGSGHFLSLTMGTHVTVDTMVANNSISSFNGLEEHKQFYFIPIGKTFHIRTKQVTDDVIRGSTNQPIIAILVTSRMGVLTTPSITAISFSTNGTTNNNDIVNAKLFSTGHSPYFSSNYQRGNTVASPNGNFSINGGGVIQDYSTNYFWLTYDVADTAELGNVLDAECFEVYFDLTWPGAPDVTAPPGNRTIVPGEGLAGIYTIGATGDFLTLTSIIDSLTETFITGPVTIELLNDYNSNLEIFPLIFPFISGNSDDRKMIIRPASDAANIQIEGNSSSILIFNSSRSIMIDGRPGGLGDQRELTIINENPNGSTIQFTGAAKNIEIINCNVLGRNSSDMAGVIQYSYSGYGLTSDSVSFIDCYIGKSNTGRPANAFFSGGVLYGGTDYWKIIDCSITDFTDYAIRMETGYRTLIENNEIYLTEPSPKNKVAAILLEHPVWSTSILRNRIHSLSSSLTVNNSIIGIEIPFSSYHTIINNFISLSGNEYSTVTGIDYNGNYASNDHIFNNTIYVYGNSINDQDSYCFRRRAAQSYAGLSLRLKNNLMINKRNRVQGSGRHYAVAIEDQRGLYQIDYNNYFFSGNGAILGRWIDQDVSDLSFWKSLTQKDTFSISKNVEFISQTDLHLTGTSLGDIDLIGQPSSFVPVDIDNEPRNMFYPYMGADENLEYPLPVELVSFSAEILDNKVMLKWITATETNNQGFEIERMDGNTKWKKIGYIAGYGTATEPKSYSFTDANVSSGKYQYRLKQIDFSGASAYSSNIEIYVSFIPLAFSLEQNYPNPFNPVTKISYALPSASMVDLKVYNVLGQLIITLVNEEKPAGFYEIDFNAADLPSGVYMYRITAGDYVQTKKMLLLK
jgi:hypothetical protein